MHPTIPSMLRPLATLSLLATAALAQAPLTIGNLFVVRVGDGTTALSNAATPTFLDEYTTAGVLVQSIVMPTAASGSNQPMTNSGTATSEGFLNVSDNGLYLTLAGYGVPPGLASVATTLAATTPRVVARVDLAGVVDTSTALSDAYSGGNIRSVVSTDGFVFWTTGSNGGVRFAPLGATTTIGINAGAPSNVRVAGIYNGQLYATSSSTGYFSVCSVGTGIPTSGPATISVLPGLPNTTGPSAYDFWFADPQTLYIADDRVVLSNGGIHKYSLVAGTWTLQYILQPAAGCRGISGRRSNGVTTLYATTGSQLVSVVDTGPASTFTVLAPAPQNTAFRGVRLLSKPTTLQRLPGACGAAGITATGNAEIGTDLVTTILNPVGIPFIGYGLTALGVPFCNCTVLHDFTVLVAGPQSTLPLPNNPALFGFQLLIQGLDFLAPGGCPDPLFTLTDGYTLTVQ